MAREQGAEAIDFELENPIETILELTHGIGVDRAIDAVGVDAEHPHSGPSAETARKQEPQFQQEIQQILSEKPKKTDWHLGDAPSQALSWAVECLAKAGTLSIVGTYPQKARFFPIGHALMKNLTVRMGTCPHRKYIPLLLEKIQSKIIDPLKILSHVEPLTSVIDAYKAFDSRQAGWMKVELERTI